MNNICIVDDPPPYIDGVRINSPHYLCKIKLGQNPDRRYTLVISQYEKTTTIYYTLRVYGTSPFTLRKIAEPYKFEKEVCVKYIFQSSFSLATFTLSKIASKHKECWKKLFIDMSHAIGQVEIGSR